MSPTPVDIQRIPISLPCPVPVLAGTPETTRDGEVLPVSERPEACAVDAWWMIGAQVTCDVHLREACGYLGLDFAEVTERLGPLNDTERKPWAERHRYPQEGIERGTATGSRIVRAR